MLSEKINYYQYISNDYKQFRGTKNVEISN